MLKIVAKAAVNGAAKVVGSNIKQEVTLQLPKAEPIALRVHPAKNFQRQELLDALMNKYNQDLGAAEPAMAGSELDDLQKLILQSHFEAGRAAAEKHLPADGGQDVTAVIAGSGNSIEDAAELAKIMDPRPDSITLSTASGGWLHNLSRGLKAGALPDDGSMRAAFLNGMVAQAATIPTNTVHAGSFSQGSHAARDAQNALTDDQLDALKKVQHTTMGGSSYQRVDSTALTSSYDPVPLAAKLDPFQQTASGQRETIQGDNWHSGKQYAARFNQEILNGGKKEGE